MEGLAILKFLSAFWEFIGKKSSTASEDKPQSHENAQWADGYKAFETAKGFYQEQHDQDAVIWFDKAIERGFENAEVFGLRGTCLQALDFNLDALEDFNRAISLDPADCNLYYLRSLSRGCTGDTDGALSDLREAIHLSKADTELNRTYSVAAKQTGFRRGHTAMYEMKMIDEELNKEMPEELRERMAAKHSARRSRSS